MFKYYVLEIQTHQDGSYGHIRHFVYDEDERTARLKGESKYHEVLAAAAISELPYHGAILISNECAPLAYQCYNKTGEGPIIDGRGTPGDTATYQYYIFEIQQNMDGEYGDITHFAYDESQDEARLKGESEYYNVLSTAAVSHLRKHGAILMSSMCAPIAYRCYKREAPAGE